jgi:Tfp pilus assembly pilus retraction ATPase PilT
MPRLKLDWLFETCLRRRCAAIWLVVGRPPLLQREDEFVWLIADLVDRDELESLLQLALRAEAWNHYQQHGMADFVCQYGAERFRVIAFKTNDEPTFAVLQWLRYYDGGQWPDFFETPLKTE